MKIIRNLCLNSTELISKAQDYSFEGTYDTVLETKTCFYHE